MAGARMSRRRSWPQMPSRFPFDRRRATDQPWTPDPTAGDSGASMDTDVAHVALHDDRESIVRDAVLTAREATASDSAFAAVRNADGSAYGMDEVHGIQMESRFRALAILPRRGLGGQV